MEEGLGQHSCQDCSNCFILESTYTEWCTLWENYTFKFKFKLKQDCHKDTTKKYKITKHNHLSLIHI